MIPEFRVELAALEIHIVLDLESAVEGRRAEVTKVRILDGLDNSRGIVDEIALESQLAIVERDSGAEGHGQNAAMLADEILPLQMNFVIGDFLNLSGVLLLAEDEIGAMATYGSEEAEGEPQFRPAFNLPVCGLVFEPGRAPVVESKATRTLLSWSTTSRASADCATEMIAAAIRMTVNGRRPLNFRRFIHSLPVACDLLGAAAESFLLFRNEKESDSDFRSKLRLNILLCFPRSEPVIQVCVDA